MSIYVIIDAINKLIFVRYPLVWNLSLHETNLLSFGHNASAWTPKYLIILKKIDIRR